MLLTHTPPTRQGDRVTPFFSIEEARTVAGHDDGLLRRLPPLGPGGGPRPLLLGR